MSESTPAETGVVPSGAVRPPPGLKSVLIPYLGVTAAIAVSAHLLPEWLGQYANSLILAAMVFIPVRYIDDRREPLEKWGIHYKRFGKDLLPALAAMAAVFPIYIAGYALWNNFVFNKGLTFVFPEPNPIYSFVEQTLFIALPEEIFYRCWMLPVFSARWPAKHKVLGVPFGFAAVATSALFALGHLASIPSPGRLAVFFPSLLFCWLRLRTRGVAASIVFHGAANALNFWLYWCAK